MIPILTAIIYGAAAQSTPCQQSIVLQVTNLFENSHKHFGFDYCENIQDGRGYTCGIVGFTSGTQDAYQVVSNYMSAEGSTREFASSLATLKSLAAGKATANVDGLDDFCSQWVQASKNSVFRKIQVDALSTIYYTPSQVLANTAGLTLAAARGQFYDTGVQHGVIGTPDALNGIIGRVNVPTPANGGDEFSYIVEFMKTRKEVLCNPVDKTTQAAWCASVPRVTSYEYAMKNNANFTDALEVLNNDGNFPIGVECNLQLSETFIPEPVKKSKGMGSTQIALAVCIPIIAIICIMGGIYLYRKRKQRTHKDVASTSGPVIVETNQSKII